MDDSDKVNIQINIAGEMLQLAVPFGEQETVRETERKITGLYDDWRRRFPKKNQTQLLAMIAYQYASYYFALAQRQHKAASELEQLVALVDGALEEDAPQPNDGDGLSEL